MSLTSSRRRQFAQVDKKWRSELVPRVFAEVRCVCILYGDCFLVISFSKSTEEYITKMQHRAKSARCLTLYGLKASYSKTYA
ncbi:hypothetical protein Plhal304r1_c006g0026211 [Plasmopara halstedii]